jgi:hypothetical protein
MAASTDIINMVKVLLSSSSTLLTSDGYEAAVQSAESELGWSLPVTNPTQIQWMAKRTLRHCFFILWTASAQKFKYKQVNLQQRFDHYDKLIRHMDWEYGKAQDSDASLFANVEIYKQFGTAVGAGFRYDKIGNDLTYEDLTKFINSEV